ncbi:MAG TPA: threonine/serine dehydratase [Gemmatimonadaceae bacterium]|jgi:threonine dehydratase|nr:threonine/serine dehydratase [Gemmatimonadaceae bacterium]
MMISRESIEAAASRIRPYIRETPVEPSDNNVWLKCEQMQRSGSFKLRGALNSILSLSPDAIARGVVTASTGNHGRAVATALAAVGARGTVYLPHSAPAVKVRALRRFSNIELVFEGDEGGATELAARSVAEREGRPYISPYNDATVIAGQGTLGLEFAAQCPSLDAVFVAVGGGGLISGIASAMRCQIVGCWPENSVAMYESMRAGEIVAPPERPTLSDATAGSVEPGAITLDLCRSLIDECVLVSEAEIADAIRFMIAEHQMIVEGAAGVAVAAYRKTAARYAGRSVGIVLCGGNIGYDTLRTIICETP